MQAIHGVRQRNPEHLKILQERCERELPITVEGDCFDMPDPRAFRGEGCLGLPIRQRRYRKEKELKWQKGNEDDDESVSCG